MLLKRWLTERLKKPRRFKNQAVPESEVKKLSSDNDYYNWDIQELRDECGKRELRYPSKADKAVLIDILEEDDINELEIWCEEEYGYDDCEGGV